MPNYSGRFMPSSLPYRSRAEPAGFAKIFRMLRGLRCSVHWFPSTETKPSRLPSRRRQGTGFRLVNILATPDLYLASVLLVLS
jgi:hypothetical protein